MPKMNQSTKTKNYSQPSAVHPSRIGNLPRLDRIIGRNNSNNYRSPPVYQAGHQVDRRQIDVSSLLKIEGKNSSQKY